MESNQTYPGDNSTKNVTSRVYGTPTIEELRMRVEVRQQEKRKKGNRKSNVTRNSIYCPGDYHEEAIY